MPTGVSTPLKNSALTIYPNPCSTCFISGVESMKDLLITNMFGRPIQATYIKNGNGFEINLTNTPRGLYFLQNRKTGEVVKFVKE